MSKVFMILLLSILLRFAYRNLMCRDADRVLEAISYQMRTNLWNTSLQTTVQGSSSLPQQVRGVFMVSSRQLNRISKAAKLTAPFAQLTHNHNNQYSRINNHRYNRSNNSCNLRLSSNINLNKRKSQSDLSCSIIASFLALTQKTLLLSKLLNDHLFLLLQSPYLHPYLLPLFPYHTKHPRVLRKSWLSSVLA